MKTLTCLCLALAILHGGCAVISLHAFDAKVADELSSEAKEKISNEIKDHLKLWIKAEMYKQDLPPEKTNN